MKIIVLFAVTAVLVLTAAPGFAHDMTIGASRWCFVKNGIIANIDLNPTLLAAIKGTTGGPYSLETASDKELRQVAADVIQPYINKRLSITVNDRAYPVKVAKLVRNENGLYTIWLNVDNIGFTNPLNAVKIDYRLLFEETNNSHINLAYLYLSDAAPDAVQKVFDYSQPAAQVTLDSNVHICQATVKGAANDPVPLPKNESPVASAGAAGTKEALQKNSALAPPTDNKSEKASEEIKSVPAEEKKLPEHKGAPPTMNATQSHSLNDGNGLITANMPKKSVWATIGEFILLGIEHILTGYDHIAFLLALIVIGLSIREVLKIVTAFTLAHSITLLLAAMQIVRLNSRLVEIVIALSICYVALENLFRKKIEYRWLVTFAFGLIHGFGFASALQELIVGKSNLLVSVLSFNLGVETGQILIFLVMLPVLHLLKSRLGPRMITAGASAAVFMVGFTWLVERVFDLKLLPI